MRLAVDCGPGVQHVGSVFDRQGSGVQHPAPGDQVLLDLAGAGLEMVAGPQRVFFQIPAQFPGFDGAERGGEEPAFDAGNCALRRIGRFVDQLGFGRGDEVVGGQAFAQGHQDGVDGGIDRCHRVHC